MAMYSKRDNGYKVGMLLFCVGLIAFVTGFATSHWAKFEFGIRPSPTSASPRTDTEVEGYTGLWTYCFKVARDGEYRCEEVSSSSPGWMTAVKVLDCTAVGVMGLVIGFFFITNCVARKVAFTRLLEVGTCLSGLLGVAGAVVYIWKSHTEDDITHSLQESHDFDMSLSWSFYLNAGGSVIVLLATILIAVYNTPINPNRATCNHMVTRPTAPPFPSMDTRGAATTLAQGHRPTGSNPYVISAAMTADAPKLYPSLQDMNQESD